MRFCQTDGTPLVNDAPPLDPYKTMVARPDDVGAGTPKSEAPIPHPPSGELLELPPETDPNKTKFASEGEIQTAMDARDEQVIDIPPLTETPAPPKFQEPKSQPPPERPKSSEPPEFGKANPPFTAPPGERKPSVFEPPLGNKPPFAEPDPIGSVPPVNPFDAPLAGSGRNMAEAAWRPPSPPDPSWQNQQIGRNTPFQPPVVHGDLNQTMAVVSLILGIVSIVLCQITGPVALITGFLARRKAIEHPHEFGGAGMALAGIITGAIGSVLLVLVVLYFIFVFGLIASQGF